MPRIDARDADPVIIEVALNGGTTKARNPNVPRDPEEIASDALACLEAGAAIVHNHIEDARITGEPSARRYADGWARVRMERPDAILYPTVAFTEDAQQRFGHVETLSAEGFAEMAAYDPGSTNLVAEVDEHGLPAREFVYINSYADIRHAFDNLARIGVGPSLAIYEPGFLRATLAWYRTGRLPRGSFVKFYFGGGRSFMSGRPTICSFGLPPSEKALDAYLDLLGDADLPWATAILGGDLVESGMARLTLERGGHLRVGLEDYGGDRFPANVDLVQRAVALCHETGRRVATPDEARTILNLPARQSRPA